VPAPISDTGPVGPGLAAAALAVGACTLVGSSEATGVEPPVFATSLVPAEAPVALVDAGAEVWTTLVVAAARRWSVGLPSGLPTRVRLTCCWRAEDRRGTPAEATSLLDGASCRAIVCCAACALAEVAFFVACWLGLAMRPAPIVQPANAEASAQAPTTIRGRSRRGAALIDSDRPKVPSARPVSAVGRPARVRSGVTLHPSSSVARLDEPVRPNGVVSMPGNSA
jgi:hypothetical protein